MRAAATRGHRWCDDLRLYHAGCAPRPDIQVTHAVVEFEIRLIELQRQLALKLMMKPPLIENDCPVLAQQVCGVAR